MKLRRMIATTAVAATALLGLAACDPAPPYSGCNLVAGSTEIDPGPFSVPTVEETKTFILGSGYDLDYNGITGEWFSTTPNSVVHGYSAEEDGHWWDCPN